MVPKQRAAAKRNRRHVVPRSVLGLPPASTRFHASPKLGQRPQSNDVRSIDADCSKISACVRPPAQVVAAVFERARPWADKRPDI